MAASRGNPVVLVADDDALIRLVLRRALELNGYEVSEANDGNSAIPVAVQESIDIMILDARMPGPTLAQTFAELRRVRPELPVLILSGLAEAPPQAGEPKTAFLTKPVDTHMLLSTVAELLSSDTYADE